MAVAMTAGPEHRAQLVRRGKRLEWLTIAWNSLEALVSIAAGLLAGSVSLVGFGFDSLIELTSGAAMLWRMSADADEERRERVERTSLRIVGGCFLALAAYLWLTPSKRSSCTKRRSAARSALRLLRQPWS